MQDLESNLDLLVERWRQNAESAFQADAAWGTLVTIGVGMVVALAVAAVILAACWVLQGRRRSPPPPESIIPGQPDGRWRYTAKKRR